MDLTIDEATPEDLPAILALLSEDALWSARETGAPEDYLAAFIALQDSPTRLYAARRGDEIVATFQLVMIRGLSTAAPLRAQIEAVRVAGRLRGQGLGSRLIEGAEEIARALGATRMQLTSDARRHDAHRFYERLGYSASHTGFKKPL